MNLWLFLAWILWSVLDLLGSRRYGRVFNEFPRELILALINGLYRSLETNIFVLTYLYLLLSSVFLNKRLSVNCRHTVRKFEYYIFVKLFMLCVLSS